MREETLYEAETEAEFVSELLRGAGFEAGPRKAKKRPRGLELVRWVRERSPCRDALSFP
jgi:hypothetical protein